MKRRRRKRSPFWDSPAGIGVEIVAAVGVVAGIAYVVKNWNSTTAGYELPVAASTLLSSVL